MSQDQDPKCGYGGLHPALSVGANTVSESIYLGRKIIADGHSASEVIGLAASARNQLGRVWRQKNLSLETKLRNYEMCVLSVLLYCAKTWTLLKADVNRFHTRSLRRIFLLRWFYHVANVEAMTAHALRTSNRGSIGVRSDSAPDPGWKRARGRARTRWAVQEGLE